MKGKCRFNEKQPLVRICVLPDGRKDVVICLNEKEESLTVENEENLESGVTQTLYSYDCNMFRTIRDITAGEVENEIEAWAEYTTEEESLLEYKNRVIDEYTLQLLEEGVIA